MLTNEAQHQDKCSVIGLMTGTSMDGVDCAHVQIYKDGGGRDRIEFIGFHYSPYPEDLKAELLKLADGNRGGSRRVSLMDSYLGQLYVDTVSAYLASRGEPLRIDLIASHGQTIYHSLSPEPFLDKVISGTLQIGEPSYLAEHFGCPVISDFRVRDQAAGGCGAPLVPFTERALYQNTEADRIFLNIGGISNITYLPGDNSEVIAFDTGPGNMLIDQAVRDYTKSLLDFDRDGLFARKGTAHQALLNKWLTHPYFGSRPPKNAGRENFGLSLYQTYAEEAEVLALSFPDFVATLTWLTAKSIAEAIIRFTPNLSKELLVSGGGSHNPELMRALSASLAGVQVKVSDELLGYPNDAKEAVAFAYMGYRRWIGETNSLPTVTGARHPVAMGKITQP